jgi:hypothetical protein
MKDEFGNINEHAWSKAQWQWRSSLPKENKEETNERNHLCSIPTKHQEEIRP